MHKLVTPGDALPLLAYKIAPRQFDLSYRFSNISLRDQIVRAQTVVRTLVNLKLIAPSDAPNGKFQLLICGAGAAGLAAAKEADALNIDFVLIERGDKVPGGILSKDAPRYVSTAMYEWPHPNHAEHSFPLSKPELLGRDAVPLPSLNLEFSKPVLVKKFGEMLESELHVDISAWNHNFSQFLGGTSPLKRRFLIKNAKISDKSKAELRAMLENKVNIHGVPLSDGTLPKLSIDFSPTALTEFGFEYVIYAVGFANEAKTYAGDTEPFKGFIHTPFWEKDHLSKKRLGFIKKNPNVCIFGSGDGALQDALRCLVKREFAHPLEIWNTLMGFHQNDGLKLHESSNIHISLAKIVAADCYTTGGAIWTHETHIFKSLDDEFYRIIDILIKNEGQKLRHAINSIIRNDVESVTILTQNGYFTKAYALNRFLVLLFEKILESTSIPTIKLQIASGKIIEFKKWGRNRRGASIRIDSKTDAIKYDLVIIRGGLDKSDSPSQLVGLSGIDTGRAGLGRIPAPIRPVAISET